MIGRHRAVWTLTWCVLATVGPGPGALPALAGHGAPVTAPSIPAEQAKRLLGDGQGATFVDLRPVEAFREGRLPGARSVPLPQLRRRYDEIPHTGPIILYCACSPNEMVAAYRFLSGEGFEDVSVLEEGYRGWVKRGYPLER
ncbi:MAG: rhodanese-like domain-containing protein [Candidatus Rokuibacteriota bacterium]